MDNAQTLMLDGQLEAGEYRIIKSRLEPEIERLAVTVMGLGNKDTTKGDMIKFGCYYLNNIDKLFTSADLDKKRQILGSTFPEKLVFENGAY